ncbi:sodium- and chloride-dependent neutral and basic amino acid transporter B(0+)-like [Rhinoraja longicauda]
MGTIFKTHGTKSQSQPPNFVLRRTSSVGETGEIVWHLALCLLLAWLIVCGALSKGIKSSGKVVYFTTTFPYVVLTALLIRGLTLEGAWKGIEFYIGSQSDFSKLADAEVWKDAATQIFYSLAIGWGSLITLSSYNKFHNNCYRDAMTVCIINCATSVFAGFVIFSILGHMSHVQDKPVSEVAKSGFGLAFIVYPEALVQLSWAPLWSGLFFFMLITLGLSSQCVAVEAVITTLLDQFPGFLRSRRLFLTAAVCLIFYLLSLTCTTQDAIHLGHLTNHFPKVEISKYTGHSFKVRGTKFKFGFLLSTGVNRFIKDIEMMIGERSWLFWLWWRACWLYISPCLMAAIVVWSLVTFAPPTYGLVEYPVWATALGWCMITFCIMWIPIVAIKRVVQAEGSTLWQKISAACTSAPDWGPYLEQHRGNRYRQGPDSAEGHLQCTALSSP